MDKKTIYIILAGLAIIAIWYFMTKKGDIDTGNSGGNTGGSTGGSTGGNTGSSTGGNTGGNTGSSTGGNTGGSTGGSTGGNDNPGFKIEMVDTYVTDPTKISSNGEVQQQKMRRDKSASKDKMYLTDGKGNRIEVDENKYLLNSSGNRTTWKYYRTSKGVYWVYNTAVVGLSVLLAWLPVSTGGAIPLGIVKLKDFDSSKVIRFTGKKRYFNPHSQMYFVAKV